MADQNRETDFVETPEVRALRHFDEDPTEEQSVKGDQQQGMREVSMIFNVKLTVEQAKDEIGIRKEPHSQTRDRSPMPHLFIINSPGNDCACKRMGNAVHKLMVTCQCPLKQRSSPLF